MNRIFWILAGIGCLLGMRGAAQTFPENYADYVNPLMGTLSEVNLSAGNTYPAIARPWGMNFWMPQTGKMGDGWAYVYDQYRLKGFKQTHQPSPWINDYGQFSIMPVIGNKITEEERQSWFSHKAEVVKPYYYRVYLADHDIVTEMTSTERAVLFRITFPDSRESRVVVDAFDRGSFIRVIPEENKIIGYTTRNSGGVPENFKNYFVLLFDKPLEFASVWKNGKLCEGEEVRDDHTGALVGFGTHRGEQVEVRVASSFISFEQAERNLRELEGKTFEEVKAEGEEVWNRVLGVFRIEADPDQMRTFYSCLYRSLLFPRQFYEWDEKGNPWHYSPYTGEVLPGYMFTDTGFWDTFRCLFPLLNLAYPSVNARIQEGLLNTYRESGFLPEWASPGHRSCMVGNNSASVVSDAILKEVTPEHCRLPLYEAMLETANSYHPQVKSTGRYGYEYYNTLGYVPYDAGIRESAARTLEYAYDDWCIAQAGKKLGRPAEEVKLYLQRSQNYRNLYDPDFKLMRGRNTDGSFQSPFNPLKWGDAFTEGNSWHYTWSVFHDVEGLVGLMGGKRIFGEMLDSVFILPPVFDASYYGSVIHEIREMQIMNMGNYAHGNQPVQHMIYLYNYIGQPWKAQYRVRETMEKMYRPTPDGYCGDEDNGQTSAWYVFSSLGFYPVCPGTDQYVIGSPLVRKAEICLENGQKIRIFARGNGPDTPYVGELKINGVPYAKNYLVFSELLKGITLDFHMTDRPNLGRGCKDVSFPYSYTREILGEND